MFDEIQGQHLEEYIAEAYRRTEERIASGEIVDDAEPEADYAQ